MMTLNFCKNAAERAAKTAAQSVLLAIGAAQGFDLFALDWRNVAGAAIGGAILSLLTSIVSSPLGAVHGSPSLVDDAPAPLTQLIPPSI